MTYRVIIQPRAETEADEAFQWLFDRSPEAAIRWYRGLREAIESLSTEPLRRGLAPENDLFAPEIRQLLYGRRSGIYRILFTVRGDVVSVLSVHHGARQMSRFLAIDEKSDDASGN